MYGYFSVEWKPQNLGDIQVARLDEEKTANEFIKKLSGGFYSYERSVNTEVDYESVKEERDTRAVQEYLESDLFNLLKETR